MGNAIEPKTPWSRSEIYETPSHRGRSSYSTPTPISHHPNSLCRAWAPKIGVCASTSLLRISERPRASNGDLPQLTLRQEERPENLRY